MAILCANTIEMGASIRDFCCTASSGDRPAGGLETFRNPQLGGSCDDVLLEVRGLTVDYLQGSLPVHRAIEDVSLAIGGCESVGLVGESGCGKTTLALAMTKSLPPAAHISAGSIRFDGLDLASAGRKELQTIRGSRLANVYQESGLSLHPMLRVGDQVADVYRAHFPVSRAEARLVAAEVLDRTMKGYSTRIFRSYPHELSGGQRQRVLIAQALVCRPVLLIADEPTASLDASSQREIVELFLALRREFSLSLLFITHSVALLPLVSDRVLVMHGGRIVEQGSVRDVLLRPRHPYTRQLIGLERDRDASSFPNPGEQDMPNEKRDSVDSCGSSGR